MTLASSTASQDGTTLPHPQQVQEFFEALGHQLAPAILSALPSGVRVAVRVTGEQGGEWTIDRGKSAVVVEPGIGDRLDCLMGCTVEDFEGLLSDHKAGVRSFLAGRLHVEGDVGLALALRQVIVPASAD